MADEEKGKGDGELSKIDPTKDLELQRALQHPVVKHMASKLEEMKAVVDSLPEAIGRAVAEAMRNKPPDGAAGPGMRVVLGGPGGDVSFGRGGQVKLDGKEEIGDPVGIQQILALVGLDPEKLSIDRITKWTPQQRQKAVAWARAMHLKRSHKGIRVPNRPSFL